MKLHGFCATRSSAGNKIIHYLASCVNRENAKQKGWQGEAETMASPGGVFGKRVIPLSPSFLFSSVSALQRFGNVRGHLLDLGVWLGREAALWFGCMTEGQILVLDECSGPTLYMRMLQWRAGQSTRSTDLVLWPWSEIRSRHCIFLIKEIHLNHLGAC